MEKKHAGAVRFRGVSEVPLRSGREMGKDQRQK